MTFVPCLERRVEGSELVAITLGHPLVDDHLEFVGARGAVNTWLAIAYDLKVFFGVVGKQPAEVTAADVFVFLAAQRAPRRGERVVRIEDGEPGLAARTIARRLSSVAGLFSYLLARGDAGVASNPVPRGLASRWPGRRGRGGVRLVRTPSVLRSGWMCRCGSVRGVVARCSWSAAPGRAFPARDRCCSRRSLARLLGVQTGVQTQVCGRAANGGK